MNGSFPQGGQNGFKLWTEATRKQAITWTNADQVQ